MLSNWRDPPRPVEKLAEQGSRIYFFISLLMWVASWGKGMRANVIFPQGQNAILQDQLRRSVSLPPAAISSPS